MLTILLSSSYKLNIFVMEVSNMSIYGYARVSSIDQNEDRQMIALKNVGLFGKNILLINNQERILNVHNIREWLKN